MPYKARWGAVRASPSWGRWRCTPQPFGEQKACGSVKGQLGCCSGSFLADFALKSQFRGWEPQTTHQHHLLLSSASPTCRGIQQLGYNYHHGPNTSNNLIDLVGLIVGFLADWLVGRLLGWFVECLLACLPACFLAWMVGCLLGCLVGSLLGWFVAWMVAWLLGCMLACMLACLPAGFFASFAFFVLSCLLGCLLGWFLDCLLDWLVVS